MPLNLLITDLSIRLSAEEVWRCLGPAGTARGALTAEVEAAADEASHISAPRAAASSFAVASRKAGRVTFETGIEIQGRLLPHLFDGAEGGVFLLATAGPSIGRRVAELFNEGEPVRAFVMDAAGSAAAMSVFSLLVERVAAELQAGGMKVGPCVKPGTDSWSMEGQRALFRALPANEVGVRLLESLLMDPQKSQSGLVPYGRDLRILNDPNASPCRSCTAARCPMRLELFSGQAGATDSTR
jgi:hypothetical protein